MLSFKSKSSHTVKSTVSLRKFFRSHLQCIAYKIYDSAWMDHAVPTLPKSIPKSLPKLQFFPPPTVTLHYSGLHPSVFFNNCSKVFGTGLNFSSHTEYSLESDWGP